MLSPRKLLHDGKQNCLSAGRIMVIGHNDSVAGVNSRKVASIGAGVMPASASAAA